MSKFTKLLFCAAVVLATCPAVRATTISWDAAADLLADVNTGGTSFSNPNGAWTYGKATNSSSSGFTALTTWASGGDFGSAGVRGFTALGSNPYAPAVMSNTTSSDVSDFNGSVPFSDNLHAGEMAFAFYSSTPDTSYTVVRWTAPQAGTFNVSASWTGLLNYGGGSLDVHLTENSSTHLFDGTVNGAVQLGNPVSTSQQVTLSAGDTLDFSVGIGNYADPTRFNATITATPEPGAMVLLATGLLGLLAYAWRKTKVCAKLKTDVNQLDNPTRPKANRPGLNRTLHVRR